MEKKDIIPYKDNKKLAEFLNQPQVKIAELITGALALGTSGAIQVGGRLAQGAIKGHFLKQVGREIKFLIDNGKIKEDYAEKKYAFQTFADLLLFIDGEVPDEDRFKAVKALFYSIIDKDAEGEEILRYQLFQISKRLNSSQLLTLKAAYELRKRKENPSSASSWRTSIAREIGHNSVGLVTSDEVVLSRENLIGTTTYTDNSGIHNIDDARLTDLGIKLIDLIFKYEDFANNQ